MQRTQKIARAAAMAAGPVARSDLKNSAKTAVYVVSVGSFCKIGHAVNPMGRVYQLQHYSPYPVILEFVSEFLPRHEALWLEKAAHTQLDRHRVRGEWFEVAPREVIAVLRSLRVFA